MSGLDPDWLKAQRSRAEKGYGGLKAEADGVLQTIETRLAYAAEAWGALWQGGEEFIADEGEKLLPIHGGQLRKVLVRQGAGKAKGADGWSPRELAALPIRWLDALGRMIGHREACGSWPAPLRNVVFSTIPNPKAKAEIEAGPRPRGLLPYVCIVSGRVIRKGQSKDWSMG